MTGLGPVAVIVPTVNRAGMLTGLVANIHAATATPHCVYLIMEDTDQESLDVSAPLDAVSVIGRFGSNAAAVNMGYRASIEPFLAIVNDDCHFVPGWDEKALAHMSARVHIVGINQGDGRCSSFSMVRRAFIEQHSGVYDQPNTLYHEYLSQFPDTEFAEYAQARGVWEDAPESVIEHQHWIFGLADGNHPNYVKARDTFSVDNADYLQRRPHFA